MNTKLTLTIEDSVIVQAKKYARQEGRSLSDLVENYLKAVVADPEERQIEITPIVKALRGSFKAPADFNYKEELVKGLSEKYL